MASASNRPDPVLYGSTMSPFVRVVRVMARETGLDRVIREVIADPWGDEAFRRINPLGKIPALRTDRDEVLFDSPVICEYLDSLHDGPARFPRDPERRWRVLTLRSCAHGLMDAAYLRRNEAIRTPRQTISQAFLDRQDDAMRAALDWLEADAPPPGAFDDIAALAVASALGYLDFRYPGCGWASRCPMLARWWESVRHRRSLAETVHRDPAGVTPAAMVWPLRL